ncbi:MAG: MBL fold metallo-hydrolase [Candidatus Omnitrophica bacterium]|nr:MBL fold metallo-hydrolase [Candidatus Omnitrophota bacterium]
MKIGRFEISIISDGTFKLDGGGMYGIVPRVLWEKKTPPDIQNRITLGMNCVLVRTGKKNFLIETGLGDKLSDKFRKIYEVQKGNQLLIGLARLGLSAKDIDGVIATHLHFDHCGGCTEMSADGRLRSVFPNAKYFVQKQEWHDALHTNKLTEGSYLEENFLPLEKSRLLELIDGSKKIEEGISVQVTGGHTKGHQIVWLESAGEKACFLGDFIPTTSHLRLAWVMAYDEYPIELVNLKKGILEKLVEEKHLCFWYHDPQIPASYLKWDEKKNASVVQW